MFCSWVAPARVAEAVSDLKAAVRRLDVEVTTLKASPFVYEGTFVEGREYLPGQFVTCGGSMWHCEKRTTHRPGTDGPQDWRLAVKRGKNALSPAEWQRRLEQGMSHESR